MIFLNHWMKNQSPKQNIFLVNQKLYKIEIFRRILMIKIKILKKMISKLILFLQIMMKIN